TARRGGARPLRPRCTCPSWQHRALGLVGLDAAPVRRMRAIAAGSPLSARATAAAPTTAPATTTLLGTASPRARRSGRMRARRRGVRRRGVAGRRRASARRLAVVEIVARARRRRRARKVGRRDGLELHARLRPFRRPTRGLGGLTTRPLGPVLAGV